MRENWQFLPLSDVCELQKAKNENLPLPYVGMEDIEADGKGRFIGSICPKTVKSSTFKFDETHLLYGRLRPYLNKVLMPNFSGHCSTEIFPIKTKPNLDKSFLFYWLVQQEIVDRIDATCTGARMPRANLKDVFKFTFALPSLEEQKRIVAVLDAAFKGLDRARAHTEVNLQNARDLFESGLANAMKGKWPSKRFDEVCVLQRGFDLPKRLREQGQFDLVTSSGVKDTHSEFKVEGPGVATGRSGSIGNVFYVQNNFWPLNTALYIKEFHGNHPKFIWYFLRNFQLSRFATGAGVPTLNRNNVHGEMVQIPESPSDQQRIVDQLDRLDAECGALQEQYKSKLTDLDDLRQSLLQKAFAGELT